jgi:osmotically-inducible protein OsmY
MTRAQDIDLRKDVLEELDWDPSIDARTIGVAIEDGIVGLTGHVPSYVEKVAAERIVKRVHGVAGVANDIEVTLPINAERSDLDIARSAVNALDWNVSVPKERVMVAVTKGWITLDGEVEWYFQKRAAEESVRSLAGVRGVSNKLTVRTRLARAQDVKMQIEAALRRSAELDARKIAVEIHDGKVTLSGTVRSWIEREDAVNAAWSAPGVTHVVDHIRIAA